MELNNQEKNNPKRGSNVMMNAKRVVNPDMIQQAVTTEMV
jgi:hypothetical protein